MWISTSRPPHTPRRKASATPMRRQVPPISTSGLTSTITRPRRIPGSEPEYLGHGYRVFHRQEIFPRAGYPIRSRPYFGLATDGHFKAGLTADLHLQGGAIDAHIPFDITVDTTYNKTTDTLLIHTNDALAKTGASFTTSGPEGNLTFGFLIDAAIDAGILGGGSVNEILPVIPGFPAQFGTDTPFQLTAYGARSARHGPTWRSRTGHRQAIPLRA